MRKLAYTALAVVLIGTILAIFFFWEWVVKNDDLAAGLLTSLILLIAFIGALVTLAEMRHDRVTQITFKISELYDSGVILEGRKLMHELRIDQDKRGVTKPDDRQKDFLQILEDRSKDKPDEFLKMTSIPAFFDMIGWLARRRCCQVNTIREQIGIKQPYEQWEPYIRKVQGKQASESLDKSPTADYGNFVWLANKVK